MPSARKFLVLPFKKARAGIVPAEMRQASNAASAERIAGSVASRFVGVVALSAMADDETGDLTEARLLVSYGEIGDLSSFVEFSPEEEAEWVPEPVDTKERTEEQEPVAKAEEAEPDPEPPLVVAATSLILTAPPEPVSAKRTHMPAVKRRRPPAPSAGPLFEGVSHA